MVLGRGAVLDHPSNRQAVGIIVGSADVAYGHDTAAFFMQQIGAYAADVSEALYGHGDVRRLFVPSFQELQRVDHDAAAGRLPPAGAAAEVGRFSGHNVQNRGAAVHAHGVHDPTHGFGVGVHVRRRNVGVRTDDRHNVHRVSTSEAADLFLFQLRDVDLNASFCSAERDVDHGAFPRHPHGKCLDLIQGYVLVIADAAFARTAGTAVLNTIAGKHLDTAVVHNHRNGDDELALAMAQHPMNVGIQIESFRCSVELFERHAENGIVAHD